MLGFFGDKFLGTECTFEAETSVSNLTQYKLFIGVHKKKMLSGVTFSFNVCFPVEGHILFPVSGKFHHFVLFLRLIPFWVHGATWNFNLGTLLYSSPCWVSAE